MNDYEPKSYYDIQLTKKQIIVLFIAGIAILTLVFFLGLMLGKSYIEAKYAQQQKTLDTKITEYQAKEQKNESKTEEQKPQQQYEFYKLKESTSQNNIKEPNIISPADEKEKSDTGTKPAASQKDITISKEYYTLQIHAFKDEKSALTKKDYYKKKGYTANIEFIDNFYKVRIGKFATREEATAFKKKFEQQEKVPAFIVKY